MITSDDRDRRVLPTAIPVSDNVSLASAAVCAVTSVWHSQTAAGDVPTGARGAVTGGISGAGDNCRPRGLPAHADRPQWEVWFGAWHILIIIGLLVAIPVLTYFTLKLWLEADVSRFPDIDRAWNDGLHALKRKGIDISDTPLFLVLGTDSEHVTEGLMTAAGMEFTVAGTPEGRTPLRWYAHADGIYLVASEVGCLTHINRQASTVPGAPTGPLHDVRGTMEPSSGRDTMVTGAPDPEVGAQQRIWEPANLRSRLAVFKGR